MCKYYLSADQVGVHYDYGLPFSPCQQPGAEEEESIITITSLCNWPAPTRRNIVSALEVDNSN